MIEPYVEIHGDASLPPLLLVHGFLSSRAQWRPNLEGLKTFCRPVIFELWGHGRSPTPDDADAYRVSSYVEIFENIRLSLGAERWWLCGQSFGAGLTLRYALVHPEHVYGQVFTNSVSGLSRPRGSDAQRHASAEALERGGLAAIEALPFHPRHAERLASAVKAEMLEDAKKISPRSVANAIRYTVPELSMMEDIGGTVVPTLLVNGFWDKAFQPLRRAAAEHLPSLEIVDLEGGHSINAEAPDRFNAEIKRFFETTKRRGASNS